MFIITVIGVDFIKKFNIQQTSKKVIKWSVSSIYYHKINNLILMPLILFHLILTYLNVQLRTVTVIYFSYFTSPCYIELDIRTINNYCDKTIIIYFTLLWWTQLLSYKNNVYGFVFIN